MDRGFNSCFIKERYVNAFFDEYVFIYETQAMNVSVVSNKIVKHPCFSEVKVIYTLRR